MFRPGGNVTGLSLLLPDTASKRLELLREAVPDLRRLAILLPEDNPVSVEEARQVQEAAATLGLGAFSIPIRSAEDIVPAFEGLKERADALFVSGNPLILSNIVRINILAVAWNVVTPLASVGRRAWRPWRRRAAQRWAQADSCPRTP